MGGFWQTTPSGPEGRNRSASEALLPAILTLGRELEPDVAVPDAAVDGEGHGLVAQPRHRPAHGPREDALLVLGLLEGEAHVLVVGVAGDVGLGLEVESVGDAPHP